MPRYWIDSNSLIEANNDHHPFDMSPTFWGRLHEQIVAGNVVAPRRVYQELTDNQSHQDEVAAFVRQHRAQLSLPPSQKVRDLVGDIQGYLYGHPYYDQIQVWRFSDGGDLWVIAHAAIDHGIVVSEEAPAGGPTSSRPKVPDVAKNFGVECVTLIKAFRRLRVKL